jgi:hypothetical protein
VSAVWARDRHFGCRVRDDLVWRGHRTLVLENEKLRVVLLLDKGLDIVDVLLKTRDVDPLYHSYAGVVHPGNRLDNAHSIMGQSIDYWPGGWQICFPNSGAPATYRGAELSFHAEAHLLRWEYQVLEDRADRIAVRCWARCLRTPFLLERVVSLEAGSDELVLADTATNDSPVEMRAAWGQHIALGPPYIEPGCTIDIKAARAWTEAGDFGDLLGGQELAWPSGTQRSGLVRDLSEVQAQSGTEDLILVKLLEGSARLVNPRQRVAVSASWDLATYPYLWLWLLYGGHSDAPTYGRAHLVALEPFSSANSRGLDAAIADGSALTFAPGETKAAPLRFRVVDLDGEPA